MNKFFIVCVLCLLSCGVNAQLWVSVGLGGTSAGSRTTVSTDTTEEISLGVRANYLYLAPTIGYDVSENLSVGASIAYSRLGDLDLTFDEDEFSFTGVQTVSFLPFVRLLKPVSKEFSVYGQLDLAVGVLTNLNIDEDDEGVVTKDNFSSTVYGVNIRPGILYKFSDNFSMNANFGALGYNAVRSKVETEIFDDEILTTVSNTYNVGLNFDMSTLNFALNYHF